MLSSILRTTRHVPRHHRRLTMPFIEPVQHVQHRPPSDLSSFQSLRPPCFLHYHQVVSYRHRRMSHVHVVVIIILEIELLARLTILLHLMKFLIRRSRKFPTVSMLMPFGRALTRRVASSSPRRLRTNVQRESPACHRKSISPSPWRNGPTQPR